MANTRRRGAPPGAAEAGAAQAAARRKERETIFQAPPSDGDLIQIDVRDIAPNPLNDREDFGDLTEISSSIEEIGLLEPIVVMPRKRTVESALPGFLDRHPDQLGPLTQRWLELWPDADFEEAEKVPWVLMAGERRLMATHRIDPDKRPKLPAIVRGDIVERMFEAMLWENLHRKDLNPMELARAFKRRMEREGLNATQLAAALHLKSSSTITKRLALLELPEAAQHLVTAGQLGPERGYELVKMGLGAQAVEATKLLNDGMNLNGVALRLGVPGAQADGPAPAATATTAVNGSAPHTQAAASAPAVPKQAGRPAARTKKAVSPFPDEPLPLPEDPAERRHKTCRDLLGAWSVPSGVMAQFLASALLNGAVTKAPEGAEAWAVAGEWLGWDPAKPRTARQELEAAFAVALAAAELRAANPRRTWDARDADYLALLRKYGGHEATPAEVKRLDAMASAAGKR
jgi:ParB/RepB/Spo0J family partition protein